MIITTIHSWHRRAERGEIILCRIFLCHNVVSCHIHHRKCEMSRFFLAFFYQAKNEKSDSSPTTDGNQIRIFVMRGLRARLFDQDSFVQHTS